MTIGLEPLIQTVAPANVRNFLGESSATMRGDIGFSELKDHWPPIVPYLDAEIGRNGNYPKVWMIMLPFHCKPTRRSH